MKNSALFLKNNNNTKRNMYLKKKERKNLMFCFISPTFLLSLNKLFSDLINALTPAFPSPPPPIRFLSPQPPPLLNATVFLGGDR